MVTVYVSGLVKCASCICSGQNVPPPDAAAAPPTTAQYTKPEGEYMQ